MPTRWSPRGTSWIIRFLAPNFTRSVVLSQCGQDFRPQRGPALTFISAPLWSPRPSLPIHPAPDNPQCSQTSSGDFIAVSAFEVYDLYTSLSLESPIDFAEP